MSSITSCFDSARIALENTYDMGEIFDFRQIHTLQFQHNKGLSCRNLFQSHKLHGRTEPNFLHSLTFVLDRTVSVGIPKDNRYNLSVHAVAGIFRLNSLNICSVSHMYLLYTIYIRYMITELSWWTGMTRCLIIVRLIF